MSIVKLKRRSQEELYPELQKARHQVGLYSLKELSLMFDVGLQKVKFAVDTKKVKSISPNRKVRYVFLSDWVAYMEKNCTNKN